MRFLKFSLLFGLLLSLSSCGNQQKKPLLPYFNVVEDKLNAVWILPNQDISGFLKLPELKMLNQSDEQVFLNDTSKRFKIISFFSSNCAEQCEAAMHNLKWLDQRFENTPSYHLVNISTLSSDSPKLLLDYAMENQISLDHRSLLCTTSGILDAILKKAFHTSLSQQQEREIYETLYLVDKAGYLRGIYDGTSTIDLENIILDSRIL